MAAPDRFIAWCKQEQASIEQQLELLLAVYFSFLMPNWREAEEEIALCRRFVEPIGYLDIHMTPFGYRIVPVLASMRPGLALSATALPLRASRRLSQRIKHAMFRPLTR